MDTGIRSIDDVFAISLSSPLSDAMAYPLIWHLFSFHEQATSKTGRTRAAFT